jgi:hypothetical protein
MHLVQDLRQQCPWAALEQAGQLTLQWALPCAQAAPAREPHSLSHSCVSGTHSYGRSQALQAHQGTSQRGLSKDTHQHRGVCCETQKASCTQAESSPKCSEIEGLVSVSNVQERFSGDTCDLTQTVWLSSRYVAGRLRSRG